MIRLHRNLKHKGEKDGGEDVAWIARGSLGDGEAAGGSTAKEEGARPKRLFGPVA